MFRAVFRTVDLFWLIGLHCVLLLPRTGCGSADVDSCHEVKTAYMMRQIGPVELVPDRPRTGQSVPQHRHLTRLLQIGPDRRTSVQRKKLKLETEGRGN